MQNEIPQRLAYRYSEVADMLGVHRDTVRKWAREGDIRVVSIGRNRLVPAAEVERLLARAGQDDPTAA